MNFVDEILLADQHAPRKQRHTAHRIWERIRKEKPENRVAESTVRHYVGRRKQELGVAARETFVPQSYDWGSEAQVDWYEAFVEVLGERRKVYCFTMRSMASGGAFHRAYYHATQQAFLEARELAFHYFGGVFRRLRYDNLKSAIKKILRGHLEADPKGSASTGSRGFNFPMIERVRKRGALLERVATRR